MIDKTTNPVKTYIRERTWNAFDEMAKEKALDFTSHQRDMARALADDLIRATITTAVSDRHASFTERGVAKDQLLACPFCGSTDLNRNGHFIVSGGIGNPSTWHFFVECKTCKAHGPHNLKEGDRPTPEDHLAAITAWNKPRI